MSKPPALTTTFTPSPSCLSSLYATSGTGSNNEPYVVVNLGPPTNYATCFPSGWATNSMAYFSPGICPSGYTSACSTLSALPTITSREATVICCPSGYTCGTNASPWVCTSSFVGTLQTSLDLYAASSKTGSVTNVFGGANAFSVQIRFQATETVSPVNNSLPRTQSPGLSTGAKAGIGVGVTIGILALLLLGVLLLRSHRRRLKTNQTAAPERTPYLNTKPERTPYLDTKPELDGTSAAPRARNASPPIPELDASQPHPASTDSQPGTRTQELIASGGFAARGVEPRAQGGIASTEPASPVVPQARLEEAAEPTGLAASREANSGTAHPREPAGEVAETGGGASAPHEARPGEVEGEHDIQQQIKRVREEKERLKRINELERLEAELQERLTAPAAARENSRNLGSI